MCVHVYAPNLGEFHSHVRLDEYDCLPRPAILDTSNPAPDCLLDENDYCFQVLSPHRLELPLGVLSHKDLGGSQLVATQAEDSEPDIG